MISEESCAAGTSDIIHVIKRIFDGMLDSSICCICVCFISVPVTYFLSFYFLFCSLCQASSKRVSLAPGPSSPSSSSVRSNDFLTAFKRYDINGDGKLDVWEIVSVFKDVGIHQTESDIKKMLATMRKKQREEEEKSEAAAASNNNTGANGNAAITAAKLLQKRKQQQKDDGGITFAEFIKMVSGSSKSSSVSDGKSSSYSSFLMGEEERETIEAFVALGGQLDKGGHVDAERIKKVINDFGLTINIDELLEILDTDKSGEIEFGEFNSLFREWQEEDKEEKARLIGVEDDENNNLSDDEDDDNDGNGNAIGNASGLPSPSPAPALSFPSASSSSSATDAQQRNGPKKK